MVKEVIKMLYDEGTYFDDDIVEVFNDDIYSRDALDRISDNENLDCIGEGFMRGYIDAGYPE